MRYTVCIYVEGRIRTYRQSPVARHLHHNEETPARAKQLSETFAGVVKKCNRHEERRLSVATRQIALSSRNGTAGVTPNFAAGMQTNCMNPITYQPCFLNTKCCVTGSRRGFSIQNVSSGREDDTYPCLDPTYQ